MGESKGFSLISHQDVEKLKSLQFASQLGFGLEANGVLSLAQTSDSCVVVTRTNSRSITPLSRAD